MDWPDDALDSVPLARYCGHLAFGGPPPAVRFRVQGTTLFVHGCDQHGERCDFFGDHALAWMLGNKQDAKAQLLGYRESVIARLSALSATLTIIDSLLARLDLLRG